MEGFGGWSDAPGDVPTNEELAAGEVRVIAGDTRLVRVGRRLLVQAVGGYWRLVAAIFMCLFGTVAGLFALVHVSLAFVGRSSWEIGLGSLLCTVLFGWLAWAFFRRRRAVLNRPPDRARTVAMFDLERSELQSSRGTMLASIDKVVVRKRMVLHNSAVRRLMVEWPGGSIELERERGFTVGFHELITELSRNGVPVR